MSASRRGRRRRLKTATRQMRHYSVRRRLRHSPRFAYACCEFRLRQIIGAQGVKCKGKAG